MLHGTDVYHYISFLGNSWKKVGKLFFSFCFVLFLQTNYYHAELLLVITDTAITIKTGDLFHSEINAFLMMDDLELTDFSLICTNTKKNIFA